MQKPKLLYKATFANFHLTSSPELCATELGIISAMRTPVFLSPVVLMLEEGERRSKHQEGERRSKHQEGERWSKHQEGERRSKHQKGDGASFISRSSQLTNLKQFNYG